MPKLKFKKKLSFSFKGICEFIGYFWIAYLCFGYPINACLSFLLGDTSSVINIASRMLTLIIGAIFFANAFFKKDIRVSKYLISVLFFLTLYTLRLIYDNEVRGIILVEYGKFKFYWLYFGNIIIPVLALVFYFKHLEIKKVNSFCFGVITLSNILIALFLIQHLGFSSDIFLARATLEVEAKGGENVSIINPITISYFGGILLASTFAKKITGSGKGLKYQVLIILGFFNLMIGASRGPMITFIFIAILLYFLNLSFQRKTILFVLRQFFFIILFFFAAKAAINYFVSNDFRAVMRIIEFSEDTSSNKKEERDFIWDAAWNQFLESPIIGDQFIERHNNFYPHNIYLEVFMATGILGGLFFFYPILGIFWIFFIRGKEERKRNLILFVLLLFQLLAALTSGALFASVSFWILIIIFFKIKTITGESKFTTSVIVPRNNGLIN